MFDLRALTVNLLSLITIQTRLEPVVIEHKYIEEILPYIHAQQDHQHTLIIFDIDETLIKLDSHFGTHHWAKHYVKQQEAMGFSRTKALTSEHKIYMETLPHRTYTFTEPTTPTVFKAIKESNAIVMGLTKRPQQFAPLTVTQLKALDINFSFPHLDTKKNSIPRSNTHIYHSGIVFGCEKGKGHALLDILKKAKYTPRRIIFIDDLLQNIKNVETALKKFDQTIDFTGIHYTHVATVNTLFDAVKAEQEFQAIQKKIEVLSKT